MNLADVFFAKPVVPVSSLHVRTVLSGRNQPVATVQSQAVATVQIQADELIDKQAPRVEAVGQKVLDLARQMLKDGPMTAPYFSVHGGGCLSHAKRVLNRLVDLGEVSCRQIRGVRPFVYFLIEKECERG